MQDKSSNQRGFNLVGVLVVVVVLVVGVVSWRVYESQKSLQVSKDNEQVATPATSLNENLWISLDEWDVKIPQSEKYKIALAQSYSSSAYGNDLGSVGLFVPEFDGQFTCEVFNKNEPNKAIFATLVQYKKDSSITGPYAPDKVIELGDKKYAIYKVGENCYRADVSKEIKDFYAKYIEKLILEVK